MIKKITRQIHDFRKTDLFKTSFWNGIATLIKMLIGIVSNKIIAIYLGPPGIALLGQFVSFTGIASAFAGMGVNSGITKYVAEYHDDEDKRKKILSSGLIAALIATFITSFVIFIGAHYFCMSILKSDAYISVFYLFASTLILFSINAFLISVLNGYKEFKKIILINIISSLVGLLITVFLTMQYGVLGALSATILSVTLITFITIFFVYKSPWFKLAEFINYFDTSSFRKLLHYTAMAFVSIIAVMYIQLMIRTYIIDYLSINEAGYWQGITRISEIFLSIVTTTLSIYYLPRLSEIKADVELRREIIKGYKFLMPLTIIGSLLIYLFRNFITDILFTNDFRPMTELFFWQFLGNVFKIASWLVAFLMLAKAMTKTYIVTEIIFGLTLYFITILFTKEFGLIGATMAYCLNYLLYFIVIIIIFRKILFPKTVTAS